jgi:hypothetical protein
VQDCRKKPIEKESNCTDTPLETLSCEGKHEGMDAMPVQGSAVYISLAECMQTVRLGYYFNFRVGKGVNSM